MKCVNCKNIDNCPYNIEDECTCLNRMECYICHINICTSCGPKVRHIEGHYKFDDHIYCDTCYKKGKCYGI